MLACGLEVGEGDVGVGQAAGVYFAQIKSAAGGDQILRFAIEK